MIYDLNTGQDLETYIDHDPWLYLAMRVFFYEFGGGRLALHDQIGVSMPNRIYGSAGWLGMHCWISRVPVS